MFDAYTVLLAGKFSSIFGYDILDIKHSIIQFLGVFWHLFSFWGLWFPFSLLASTVCVPIGFGLDLKTLCLLLIGFRNLSKKMVSFDAIFGFQFGGWEEELWGILFVHLLYFFFVLDTPLNKPYTVILCTYSIFNHVVFFCGILLFAFGILGEFFLISNHYASGKHNHFSIMEYYYKYCQSNLLLAVLIYSSCPWEDIFM